MYKSTSTLFRTAAMAVLLFVGLLSAGAATITYKLTTHKVFGASRELTGTASVSAGADLLDNMPQALWRAYTTYKFYSDEALTQEITEAPAEDATVYVGYVFDPNYIPSIEGEDPVWNFLRGYNEATQYTNGNVYLLYKRKIVNQIWTWEYSSGAGLPKAGTNNQMDKSTHCYWALYGDGYNCQIKLNDDEEDLWLIWQSTTQKSDMGVGSRPTVGWQLYTNKAISKRFPNGGAVALGVPDVPNLIYENQSLNYKVSTTFINDPSKWEFNSHNELIGHQQGSMNYQNELWWYALMATPTMATNPNLFHVTYKILMGYDDLKQRGNDIYEKKTSTAMEPKLDDKYKLADTEEYKYAYYYFKDPELTEMWEPGETMPTNENTIVYVLEDRVITTTWKTLSLPVELDPKSINMEVLEYTSVQTTLSPNGGYNFHLVFTPTDLIEEDKPYLYRFVDAGETIVARFNEKLNSDFFNDYISEGETPIEVPQIDPAYPEVQVIMKGAFENFELTPMVEDDDPYYFYFGYNSVQQVYKFYPVTKNNVTMTPWKCYFFAVGVPEGSSVGISMDDTIDGISQFVVNTDMGKTSNKGVYNLNGQLINNNGSTVGLPAGIYMVNGKKMIVK